MTVQINKYVYIKLKIKCEQLISLHSPVLACCTLIQINQSQNTVNKARYFHGLESWNGSLEDHNGKLVFVHV